MWCAAVQGGVVRSAVRGGVVWCCAVHCEVVLYGAVMC